MFYDRKYKQQIHTDLIQKWISNCYSTSVHVLLHKILSNFFVPFAFSCAFYTKATKDRLNCSQSFTLICHLGKSLTVLVWACISCLPCICVAHVNDFYFCICVAHVNQALEIRINLLCK